MFYIVFVILLFIASVMVHISYCRQTTKTGLQAKTFIFIAMTSLGIYLAGVATPLMASHLDPHSLWGMPFKITAGIIFILFIPIYLCFYVLTQLTSPSKKILLTVAQSTGASYNEIVSAIDKENFIITRLHDLCASGCVRQINGCYILTSEGQKIEGLLNIMQSILGRKVGG
jgi:hypothetical protein